MKNDEEKNNILTEKNQEEKSVESLLTSEMIIGILGCVFLFVPIIVGSIVSVEDWQKLIIIFSGFIPVIIAFGYCLKIEQIAGYYECKECGHRYVPTYKAVVLAPHMGRTRYMKCPECSKKSW